MVNVPKIVLNGNARGETIFRDTPNLQLTFETTDMQVKDAIFNRRAIKHFDADHKMTDAEEKELLETTIQAPTSFNIQHWRFVILRDPVERTVSHWAEQTRNGVESLSLADALAAEADRVGDDRAGLAAGTADRRDRRRGQQLRCGDVDEASV